MLQLQLSSSSFPVIKLPCYHRTYCTSTCFPPLRSWSHANIGCFDPTSLSSHDPISSHSNVLCIQILTFHLHKHFGYLRKHLNYAKLLLSSRLKMVRNVWNFRNVYSVPEVCFCNSQHPSCTRCLPLAPVSKVFRGQSRACHKDWQGIFNQRVLMRKNFVYLSHFYCLWHDTTNVSFPDSDQASSAGGTELVVGP